MKCKVTYALAGFFCLIVSCFQFRLKNERLITTSGLHFYGDGLHFDDDDDDDDDDEKQFSTDDGIIIATSGLHFYGDGLHFDNADDEQQFGTHDGIMLSLEGNDMHDIHPHRPHDPHHHPHDPHKNTTNNIDSSNDSDNVIGESSLTYVQMQAQKYLTNKDSIPRPPNLTLGAFIHVGKTGGSTVSSSLLRYGCHSFALSKCQIMRKGGKYIGNETAVSKLTTYYHVPDFRAGELGLFGRKGRKHQFYLFTVRDPLARTISSYLYLHPLNQIAEHFHKYKTLGNGTKYMKRLKKLGSEEAVRQEYTRKFHSGEAKVLGLPKHLVSTAQNHNATYNCAPTLEDYAMLLGQEDGSDCARLAKVDLSHKSKNDHMKNSLTYITSNLLRARAGLTNKTILALRTEYLNDDWISSNEYLGQEKETVTDLGEKVRDSSAVERPVISKLSEEGRRRICAALKMEYNVYFGILNQAANIGPQDVAKGLAVAKKNCPWLEFNSLPQLIDEAFKG